jgi:shikimate dehydrogenase
VTARKAAVLGFPVEHSRSPQLHLAAYRALGLDDWTYDRIACTADELPSVVSGFGPEWVGVSVTMPGKFAALRFADERTERAQLVGSANTLVRTESGWRADNTDVDGVAGALDHRRDLRRAIVLGSGATAPAAVVALAGLGVTDITVAARNKHRAARLLELGATLGARTHFADLADTNLADTNLADTNLIDTNLIDTNLIDTSLAGQIERAEVLVSTIPSEAAALYASSFAVVPVLLDAIYDPWPTPLAQAVANAGGQVVGGLQMLLHQAYSQVEQFTGRTAPRQQMAAALD